MKPLTRRFTWHLSFKWTWRPYARDAFLDGGSVEWQMGPFTLEKRIHWLR